MIRPRNVWISGILLVGFAGCAGLRRQPPPMIGPGVAPTPIAASAEPVQANGVTPFAEPGGGIGRFVPGRYQQIKQGPKPATRWVDPYVQRRKEQPDPTELAGIFPQRQPIGSGRLAAQPPQDEAPMDLPVALNIPVYPEDDPVETARAPRSTRRLSGRIEPEVRPSRWRVPQAETETGEQDPPPQDLPRQARRRPQPRMPEVPREQLAFGLLDDVAKPAPQPEPEVEAKPPALVDPPVEAAAATSTEQENSLLEIPENAQVATTEKAPPPEPVGEPVPSEAAPKAWADEPNPLLALVSEPTKADQAPAPAPAAETQEESAPAPEPAKEPEPVNTPEETTPAPTPEPTTSPEEPSPTPEPTSQPETATTPEPASQPTPTPEPEPAPTPEAASQPEPEPITEPEPHPAALSEPPPFVPGSEPEPNGEADDDPAFAEPPPLSGTAPGVEDQSALPHPPLPSRNMVAESPAPTSDPAAKRIATEVADTTTPKSKPKSKPEKPARRSLWSRLVGDEAKADAVVVYDHPKAPVFATPGTGLANMPPALFLPSYYGPETDSKRDEETQKVSTSTPETRTEKPHRFRLFRRLRGE